MTIKILLWRIAVVGDLFLDWVICNGLVKILIVLRLFFLLVLFRCLTPHLCTATSLAGVTVGEFLLLIDPVLLLTSVVYVILKFINQTLTTSQGKLIWKGLSSNCNIASFGSLGNQKIVWVCWYEQYTLEHKEHIFPLFSLEPDSLFLWSVDCRGSDYFSWSYQELPTAGSTAP